MWGTCNSPYGQCVLQWNKSGSIERLYFASDVALEGERDDLQADRLAGDIFAGRVIGVSLSGSELEMAVWEQLRRIPRGETRTYKQIAEAIGRGSAVRAVASAIGRNEVSYLVPCHRVVRTDGSLGGYRWGLAVKRRLLDDEQR